MENREPVAVKLVLESMYLEKPDMRSVWGGNPVVCVHGRGYRSEGLGDRKRGDEHDTAGDC